MLLSSAAAELRSGAQLPAQVQSDSLRYLRGRAVVNVSTFAGMEGWHVLDVIVYFKDHPSYFAANLSPGKSAYAHPSVLLQSPPVPSRLPPATNV